VRLARVLLVSWGLDPVQHGHAGATGGEQSRGGQADTGRAAGDQRGPPREFS